MFVILSLATVMVGTSARGASFLVAHPVPWSPLNLAVQGKGVIWMTFPGENFIGRLIVDEDGLSNFTAFRSPTEDSEPYDIVFHDGAVWFTQKAGNQLARLEVDDLAGKITEYALPTDAGNPTGLTVGPDGRIWVLEQGTSKLAVFDPSTTSFEEFDFPLEAQGTSAEKIVARRDNTIWFTAPEANRVVSFEVETSSYSSASTISPSGIFEYPLGITMDPDDRPWVTAQGSDAVGRYTPETLSFWRWYQTPHADGGVAEVRIIDAGTRWQIFFSEADSNSLGLLVVRSSDSRQQAMHSVSLPTAGGRPWDLDVDEDGTVWITDVSGNAVVAWQSPYVHQSYLPQVFK